MFPFPKGARFPGAYLYRSVRGQVSRVFPVPAIVGTALIYAFCVPIMHFNGDPPVRLSAWAGAAATAWCG
ncbi:MAG: hypothetical protein Q4C45_01070 [Oscillospiraceae bacterium]|nr:hypothetical protein [Oscillospiraceae bacterium]